MDEAKGKLISTWLLRASHDLGSAQKLATKPQSYLDMAVYHCQQAAEKAIKALLIFHDQAFNKTHDVHALVTQVEAIEPSLGTYGAAASMLTPYATTFRYAEGPLEPDEAEFHEAFENALQIYEAVLALLPKDVHPPSI